jgi:hypothetical protein
VGRAAAFARMTLGAFFWGLFMGGALHPPTAPTCITPLSTAVPTSRPTGSTPPTTTSSSSEMTSPPAADRKTPHAASHTAASTSASAK